ncbi:hypothetical protein PMI01_01513 [Caulobacter sp. AP07]|uniref:hypothetical protein n=1 Tax=Caulobacter sp. AP07 TaxID=1144304 RepID=UPI00027215D1|nr:hypothetical protein [Caulobacter sp. AP07]EJL34820.1 hypothetical protein PMI01_01513 [Caulobacter sp. AP07]
MRKIIGLALSAGIAMLGGAALAQTVPPPPAARAAMQQYDQIKLYEAMRPNARLVPRESGNPLQVKAAAKMAADLRAPCEVVDAAPLSTRPTKSPEFEIVCKDALGWIISKSADGKPQLNDCLALDTAAFAAGKAWPLGMVCSLPGNAAPVAGLRPIAAKVAPGCALSNGTFLGGGGQPAILRYEIRCKSGAGYIVDTPAPGSAAPLSSLTCDEAKAAGVACTLAGKTHG